MTTTQAQQAAAAARMAVDPDQLRPLADTFAAYRPGTPYYANCLANYYAKVIHILYDAHLTECIVVEGNCQTCNGIRVGLTCIGADLLAANRLARYSRRLAALL
jgi:hypothetical protein